MKAMTLESQVKVTLIGFGVIAAAACGGDDATGPGGEPVTTVDVTGVWQFDRSFSTQFGATKITATLDLQQEGKQITGSHRNGRFESSLCSVVCTSDFRDVADGPVSGSVSGSNVVLEFNADDLGEIDRFEGTVTGDTIQGNGWSAVRGTGGGSELAAPTNLQAAVVETGSGPAVDLSWNDNSADEDGFAVGESCDGAEYATVAEAGPDATGTRVTGPFPGTECTYAVVAFREDGDDLVISHPSNTATVTIP